MLSQKNHEEEMGMTYLEIVRLKSWKLVEGPVLKLGVSPLTYKSNYTFSKGS